MDMKMGGILSVCMRSLRSRKKQELRTGDLFECDDDEWRQQYYDFLPNDRQNT